MATRERGHEPAVDMELQPLLRGSQRPGEQSASKRIEAIEQKHGCRDGPERQASGAGRGATVSARPRDVDGEGEQHQRDGPPEPVGTLGTQTARPSLRQEKRVRTIGDP